MRWNLRPRAVATDLAREVFPVPGGPTRSRIGDLSMRRLTGVMGRDGAGLGVGEEVREGFELLALMSSLDVDSGLLATAAALEAAVSLAVRSTSSWCLRRRTARYSRRRRLIFSRP